MLEIRFATIGTSKITRNFLSAASNVPEFKLEAVYSRNIKNAEEFGNSYGVTKFYDNLTSLAEDSTIDAVYIASPNAFHCSQAIQMMKAGKHILCEKTIASNQKEAEEMFRTASENHVILLEAMRSVFDPGMDAVKANMNKLGMIRRATVNYCQYSSRYDSFLQGQDHNIFRRDCSAGALMDIGTYCVHGLLCLFGKPQQVVGFSDMIRGDIDGAGTILAKYPDMIAEVEYSKITNSKVPSEIQGEKGIMLIHEINCLENVKIIYNDGTEEVVYFRNKENNMKYELEHFIRMIHGQEQNQLHTQRSLDAIELMDEIRRQCHISFPADK